jgi:hypothetical protein
MDFIEKESSEDDYYKPIVYRFPSKFMFCIPTNTGIKLLGIIEFTYCAITLSEIWELEHEY